MSSSEASPEVEQTQIEERKESTETTEIQVVSEPKQEDPVQPVIAECPPLEDQDTSMFYSNLDLIEQCMKNAFTRSDDSLSISSIKIEKSDYLEVMTTYIGLDWGDKSVN